MSVDVIPPGQRRRIAVIGSGNKRMLSREGLAQMLCETESFILCSVALSTAKRDSPFLLEQC